MAVIQRNLSLTFLAFFRSKKAEGIVLFLMTALSLVLANSTFGAAWANVWHVEFAGLSAEHWINDGLMAIFFLLIGLELERELYNGELSDIRNALLPIAAALGGVAVPAAIHYALNGGTPTQDGIGIPMATDIAFALGVLALLGSSVPASLKIFLAALAVIDDLCAIIVIALFYTSDVALYYLFGAIGVFGLLVVLNRLRVVAMLPYLVGGALMWFLMLKSGVHATIAGVLLAFAIPFSAYQDDVKSPSHRLEHILHRPVAYLILPLFALANTAIVIEADWMQALLSANSLGIIVGLVIGKPVGIVLMSALAVAIGLCRLPLDLGWRHVIGAGLLGGIGFTMSIFIANLAFPAAPALVAASKMAILAGSLIAATLGSLWLLFNGKPTAVDTDPNTMDFGDDEPDGWSWPFAQREGSCFRRGANYDEGGNKGSRNS
jgi:NhaA family Na+:H+ antiporter